MNAGEVIFKIFGDDANIKKTLTSVGKTAQTVGIAVGKALAVGFTAAAAAVGVLVKQATEGFAELEQLRGGIETLFGAGGKSIEEYAESMGKTVDEVRGEYDRLIKAQEDVFKYADDAYKSAGMSANQYMETVTGFSASLISSLGGDTQAAAELANTAVIDMADNANKMGTEMASIQNAYQGFAKQNYTMLDNLKLGYGGTKTEMERLLVDAQKLTGIDYNIDSFADVVSAIHAIQDEMGINGTTADEAAKTISGSMGMMKAAWSNLVTGMADDNADISRLLDNFVQSFVTAFDNITPRLEQALVGISEALSGIAPIISEMFPELVQELVPPLIKSAEQLINALIQTLPGLVSALVPEALSAVTELVQALTGVVPGLVDTLTDVLIQAVAAVPDIAECAVDIILALADGISEALPELMPAVSETVARLAEIIADNADELTDAAFDLIITLADSLSQEETLAPLLEKAPEIAVKLSDALGRAAVKLIAAADEFLSVIADNLVHHDWRETAEITMSNIANALLEAQKGVQVFLDNIFSGGELYGGDTENVVPVDSYSYGAEVVAGWIGDAADSIANAYDDGNEILGRKIEDTNKTTRAMEEAERQRQRAMEHQGETNADVIARIKSQNKELFSDEDVGSGAGANGAGEAVDDEASALETALENLEHLFKTHKITEEQYWADKKAILEKYRNEESEDWWDYYDKVTDYYEKAAETEEKAREKAAKEQESSLKEQVQDRFRELETEQLEKGYDDSWLLEQKRAFIETLDHNSETYKDYNLKILEEQKKYDDKAASEAESAAEKQRDTLKNAYDSVIRSRDSMAERLSSAGDIFSETSSVNKRTGEETKSGGIDIEALEKKIKAKRQLSSMIAELYEKNAPDSLVNELLNADPEAAVKYASELLNAPDKLSRLSKDLALDERYSNAIANTVTENSEEFANLGEDAGTVFGESFIEAFRRDWEAAFEDIFSEENTANISASVQSANAAVGNEVAAAAVRTADSEQQTAAAPKNVPAPTNGQETYKIIDLSGAYVAKVVKTAQTQENIRSGG